MLPRCTASSIQHAKTQNQRDDVDSAYLQLKTDMNLAGELPETNQVHEDLTRDKISRVVASSLGLMLCHSG